MAAADKPLVPDSEDPREIEQASSFDVRARHDATGSGAPENTIEQEAGWQRMDKLTKLAVNLATLAYLPLQVPQIVKNSQAKDPSELKGLAWQGTTTGALGNLLLCTYFTSKREWAAVRVQAIGAITNFIVVVQIWAAGYCPEVLFWLFGVILVIGLVIPTLTAGRCLPLRVFSLWQEFTTAIGLASLLGLVASTINDNEWLFAGCSLAGFLIMVGVLIVRPPRVEPLLGLISGWLATLLFMFMPVPQVINNFLDHEKAKSFAIGFAVLAAIGNGLCSARALFTKDSVWFTGAIWGTLIGGWLTATSVFCAHYLQLLPYLLYSAGLLAFLLVVVAMNGHALHESPTRQLAFLCGSAPA